MAEEANVPFFGSIPMDPQVSIGSENGLPFADGATNSPAAKAFIGIVEKIETFLTQKEKPPQQ